jgi:hypothetical protein
MFGLEKKEHEKFAFDLEKEIKDQPTHGKKFIEKAEARILEIKKLLREGAGEKQFDELDILLHGYGALKKTLQKIAK